MTLLLATVTVIAISVVVVYATREPVQRIRLVKDDKYEVDVYLNGKLQERVDSDCGYEIARLAS